MNEPDPLDPKEAKKIFDRQTSSDTDKACGSDGSATEEAPPSESEEKNDQKNGDKSGQRDYSMGCGCCLFVFGVIYLFVATSGTSTYLNEARSNRGVLYAILGLLLFIRVIPAVRKFVDDLHWFIRYVLVPLYLALLLLSGSLGIFVIGVIIGVFVLYLKANTAEK
jgi:hypothetical protein